jgi:hypothetical protein
MTVPNNEKFFLSFDCGTKSLAFTLMQINVPELILVKQEVCGTLQAIKDGRANWSCAFGMIESWDLRLKSAVRFVSGGVVDLCPGKKDKEIKSVQRIRAVATWINTSIQPIISSFCVEPPIVLVEFQLGANANARTVSTALVTLFANNQIYIVGPALKNQITIYGDPHSYWGMFMENLQTNYAANKAHSIYCFRNLAKKLGWTIPGGVSAKHMHDLADSCMQIFGFMRYGNHKDAVNAF